MAKMKKYATVEEYLADQPEDVRDTLESVRRSVLAVVPDATEKIGYGMPGFYVEGRPLVYYSAFKEHCSLFPASGEVWRSSPAISRVTGSRRARFGPDGGAAAGAAGREDREGEARRAPRLLTPLPRSDPASGSDRGHPHMPSLLRRDGEGLDGSRFAA